VSGTEGRHELTARPDDHDDRVERAQRLDRGRVGAGVMRSLRFQHEHLGGNVGPDVVGAHEGVDGAPPLRAFIGPHPVCSCVRPLAAAWSALGTSPLPERRSAELAYFGGLSALQLRRLVWVPARAGA
jgi:hypothetical protein